MSIIPQADTAPQPALGSAMAELLTHIPTGLADQIRDAWSSDLLYMFTTGMDAGQNNVWTALKAHGYQAPETPAARPQLRVLIGGAR